MLVSIEEGVNVDDELGVKVTSLLGFIVEIPVGNEEIEAVGKLEGLYDGIIEGQGDC